MFRRRRSANDFAEEIQAHLVLEADELEACGVPEDEAQRRARVTFGSVAVARERFNLRGHTAWLDDLLQDAGQAPLSQSVVDSMLSGYDLTNQLDTSLLTAWTDATASIPSLGPDAIFSGEPLISAQPLVDLVGYGFDIFNFFGA